MSRPETTTLVVPIRSFGGMTRLATALDTRSRRSLSRSLAGSLVDTADRVGLPCRVVTSDPVVADWAAARGCRVIRDPATGLDGAAVEGTSSADRWIFAHADLPLVTASALALVVEASNDSTVLVPSLDGGTNVIAATGSFPFSFGPGSFHRHLAAVPTATVICSAELSCDLDEPRHLTLLGVDRHV